MAIDNGHVDFVRFRELEARAKVAGGERRQHRQRRLGRQLARDRVALLVDEGSWQEIGRFVSSHSDRSLSRAPLDVPGDGVITGIGSINGRTVAIYAFDVTVLRGSLGIAGGRKIERLLELALERNLPVIALHDSDGVRVDEGPEALATYGRVLGYHARLSGAVVQIALVFGLSVGGAAYSTALVDIVIGVSDQGYLFVTGAKVTKLVTNQDVSIEELGAVSMHAKKTGLVHLCADNEEGAIELAKRSLSYFDSDEAEISRIASSRRETQKEEDDVIMSVLPDSDRKGYDVRKVLRAVVDEDSLLELQSEFARSIVVAFARLDGRSIGLVASQPSHNAGCLDIDASRKAARFVQLCSAFGLPTITFCDVPGFLPGAHQEQNGLLLHGAKLISAYANSRSLLISVILRKSYGGGNVLAFPADLRFAYPLARVQAMGPAAAQVVTQHSSYGSEQKGDDEKLRSTFGQRYDAMERAAEVGFVDVIIHPRETRSALARAIKTLHAMPARRIPARRHSNPPT